MPNFALRSLSVVCVGLVLVFPAACKSGAASTDGGAGASSSGAEISGPPVIDPVTGARLPRECTKVTHRPSAAEAAALNQCATELKFSSYQVTYQEVHVEFGKSRAFSLATDAMLNDADPSSEVIPIRGSEKMYNCSTPNSFDHNEGANCRVNTMPATTGACWKMSFGDWMCKMTQVGGTPPPQERQAPPKTY